MGVALEPGALLAELYFARCASGYAYTHQLFRFPAKFHPAVVRKLITEFTQPGDRLLDPFCGSGTLLVESRVLDRSAVGIDVDPLAVFITRAKTHPISPGRLSRQTARLEEELSKIRRPDSDYEDLIHEDFSDASVGRFRSRYQIPAIPNIHHWFRNYVAIDLARIRMTIAESPMDSDVRRFLFACFASIIRNSSNADPVPVSGLEVTKHMRERDEKGRRINPFSLFENRVRRASAGMQELWEARGEAVTHARQGSATALSRVVSSGTIDVAITSPPYNLAVDYYRRHMLEMYWLGLVTSPEERLALAPRYVGRAGVRVGSPRLKSKFSNDYLSRLLRHAREISPKRERDLKHYAISMKLALESISRTLRPGGKLIMVVGNAKWNGHNVRATKLIQELAQRNFSTIDTFGYPIQNRYMSYTRHNGADVNRESVIVLSKKSTKSQK